MTAALLRVMLLVAALCGGVAAAAPLVGAGAAAPRALRGFDEGCRPGDIAPCWQGIRLGVTGVGEARRLLRARGYVELESADRTIRRFRPPADSGLASLLLIHREQDIYQVVLYPLPTVRLGDLALVLGPPRGVFASRRRDTLGMTFDRDIRAAFDLIAAPQHALTPLSAPIDLITLPYVRLGAERWPGFGLTWWVAEQAGDD